MSGPTYLLGGREVSEADLLRGAPGPAKRPAGTRTRRIDESAIKSTTASLQDRGWEVVGISRAAMARAKAHHEAAEADAKDRAPRPWNEAAWLAKAKQKPIPKLRFATLAAAELAADMARAKGEWMRVEARRVIKAEVA